MDFEGYLTESSREAVRHAGIKLHKDETTGEHSATVEKNYEGHLQIAKLHNHLKGTGWKHTEHASGHVFTHPTTKHTVTIYHKSQGPNGENHHEIVLGNS